jgi:hypothetical protein
MSLSRNIGGYLCVSINHRKTYQHILIAEQFLFRPEGSNVVDHINHIKDDNHLDNLRWTTQSENLKNLSRSNGHQLEYFDELPEGSEPITEVRNHTIAHGYYRHDNEFFVEVAGRYRKLIISQRHDNSYSVRLTSPEGRQININWRDQ